MMLAVSGLMLLLPRQAAEAATSGIAVTHVASPSSGPCLPAIFAASANLTVTATTFSISVVAHAPICDAVTAVVYSMPTNPAWPWPQRKVESKTFMIGAGLTTVVFTRVCAPTQFDLVTGDTPVSIEPFAGPMHGPMLLWAPWTGFQDWAAPCAPGSSTTSTETSAVPGASTSTIASPATTTSIAPAETTVVSTSVVTSPSTTAEPSVLGVTTIAAGNPLVVPPTVVPTRIAGPFTLLARWRTTSTSAHMASPVVLASTEVRGELAKTGSSSAPPVALGAGLLVCGTLLLLRFGPARRR